MTYTLEDFNRDYLPKIIASIPMEARLKGIPVEERLKGIIGG